MSETAIQRQIILDAVANINDLIDKNRDETVNLYNVFLIDPYRKLLLDILLEELKENHESSITDAINILIEKIKKIDYYNEAVNDLRVLRQQALDNRHKNKTWSFSENQQWDGYIQGVDAAIYRLMSHRCDD